MIHKNSIIEKYVEITGIQSQKNEDLESIYNLKKQIEIDQQTKVLNEEIDRKKKWRKRTFVVSAIAILEGVIIYLIVSI